MNLRFPSALLAVVLVLSAGLLVRGSLTTNKQVYQFGESITANWNGVPDVAASVGVFLPGQCLDTSSTCVADTETYPYLQSADVTAASGTYTFTRNLHTLYTGSLDVRIWDSTTDAIIFNTTVQVSGSVNLNTPASLYLDVPSAIKSEVTSMYAGTDDWIGLFEANLCQNPDDCWIAFTYVAAPPATITWWNTTFYRNERINTTASYKLAYVSGGTAATFWPGVYTDADRYRAVSDSFQFQLSGSIQSSKAVFDVQEPINITWSSDVDHSDYDCVAVYAVGTSPGDNGGDAWLHSWVPVGASGTITLRGIPQPGQYVAYYLVSCTADLIASSVSFNVQNQVSISSKPVCLPGRQLVINFNTTGFQGGNDVIHMYTDACATINDIQTATDTTACRMLGVMAWIPASTKLGQVSMVCPNVNENGLVDGKFRLWYMSDWSYPLTQISGGSVQSVTVLGKCATGCSNANTFCTSNSQCTSCTGVAAPTCVPVPAPTFTGATKENNWGVEVFPGGAEGIITFTIEALENGNGPLTLEQTGFSADAISSGEVSIVKSAITGGSKWVVTWNTKPMQQNYYVDFCFAVYNTYGAPSEDRCYFLQTRGRNCRSYGDPHMTTFDGVAYDFFGYGDFYLIKSLQHATDKFSVQVRYNPCGGSGSVSCNNAVAFTDAVSSFAIYFKTDALPQYAYDKGSRSVLAADSNTTLPNGAMLQFDSNMNTLYVVLRSGIYVEIQYVMSPTNNLQVKMPSSEWLGKVGGLCGVWDNNAGYEFVYANGSTLNYGTSTDYDLYTWGTTWRVAQNESAFDYTITGSGDGFFNYTYNGVNFAHPTGGVPNPSSADPQLTQNAETLCGTILGLTDQEYSACLFDIQVTGSLEAASIVAASFVQGCSQSASLTTQCKINEGCPNRCNFRGTCSNSVCSCINGFGGLDCAAKVTAPPPVQQGAAPKAQPPNSASKQSSTVLALFVAAIGFLFMM